MAQGEVARNIERLSRGLGSNQVELLLFHLDDSAQLYAINVFKVREIMPLPAWSPVPRSDPRLVGLAHLRGEMISLIDLPFALGRTPPLTERQREGVILLTEFFRHSHAFCIDRVERIVYRAWDEIEPPPEALSAETPVTGVTRYEDRLVQILDLESLLMDITGTELTVEGSVTALETGRRREELPPVIAVDDSLSARRFMEKLLDQLEVPFQIYENGQQALRAIRALPDCPLAVITDLEMPVMDGYSLIRQIREHSSCPQVPIAANSSISGSFNDRLVAQVRADTLIHKWDARALTDFIQQAISRLD